MDIDPEQEKQNMSNKIKSRAKTIQDPKKLMGHVKMANQYE